MTIGPIHTHHGVCDASAAVFLEGDGTRFLVANDEDQHHTLLREYDAARDGPPIREHHLDNSVLRPDEDEPEMDLEGSAWMNGRIYWIGSHSRGSKGQKRPSRQRLFATVMRGGEPRITGAPYCTLLDDIRDSLGLKLQSKAPPKDGGVSIEGLAATACAGELLIGFRSPLIERKALLVPLRNAEAVVDQGAPASLGAPMLLDLDGLGLRSIDYWPERNTFLLIAGSSGDTEEEPRLLRWSGLPASKPQPVAGIQLRKLGKDLPAPEGLCVERRSGAVYLLFDEGNRLIDGVKCKDSKHKSFRSVSLLGL